MTTQTITPSEQLVPVFTSRICEETVQVCDARALHTYLESATRFNDWIAARIEKYQFIENQDFICFTENSVKPTGGRPSKDYHITLDMAKELAMVENNTKGREVRRYFIQVEKQAMAAATTQPLKAKQYFADQIPPDFNNPATAARAWADMARSMADVVQNLANAYEQNTVSKPQQPPVQIKSPPLPVIPQSPLTSYEITFIHAWWECFGTKTVTASDLYRAIATKQCQVLNDSSGALLGDIALWTPKKLGHALRRWSSLTIDGYAIQNIGKSSHGILWQLELTKP